ncbi:MAG: hypothetical protein ACI8S6_005635 [Myxococcota bacterium]
MYSPQVLILSIVLLGCAPAIPTVEAPADSGTPDTDTDTDVDTDTNVDTDTDTDTIEGEGGGRPVFSPDGGAFTEAVTVTLSASRGGEVWACVAEPDDVCELEAYTAPIVLTGSAVVHAQVGEERRARSFVALDAEAMAFSSDVSVMVFWTDDSEPDSDTDVAMGLDVFEPAGEGKRTDFGAEPADSGRARLHLRGSSSYGAAKPSYDLELWEAGSTSDRGEALLGLPSNGDWVLYAPYYYDNALVRNSLAYALSNDIDQYAPRTRPVELFLAERGSVVGMDDYRGVYILTEEIEPGADRVDITTMTPDDNAEPEVSGGYLFKRDRAGDREDGFWAGDAGGQFSFSYPLVWVDPSERDVTDAQQDYLVALLDDLALALVSSDYTSPDSGLHYAEIIDLDSWIDHHILNVLFKNPDAFRLSGYMHKERGEPLAAGPMWDLDRTAGGNDYRASDPTRWDASNLTYDTTFAFDFGWYGGMFEDPAFREVYWSRWAALLAGELSAEQVEARLDGLADELREAAGRNSDRWGTPDFDGEIGGLKVWLRTRSEWIEDCLERYDDPRTCPG